MKEYLVYYTLTAFRGTINNPHSVEVFQRPDDTEAMVFIESVKEILKDRYKEGVLINITDVKLFP